MQIQPGKNYLITADNWFYAPDGTQRRGVWGTLKAIHNSTDVLGFQPNRNSTNWYVEIGNMMLAGCQIHYVIQTDNCNFNVVNEFDASGPDVHGQQLPFSRIYNANVMESK
ncbi:TPA: hypothetical protein SIF59_003995 [Escherichia coli]|nr:hypothetical protein [Escherichia coli]HEI0663008.1 hypothetical protein [Escherichia coli]